MGEKKIGKLDEVDNMERIYNFFLIQRMEPYSKQLSLIFLNAFAI